MSPLRQVLSLQKCCSLMALVEIDNALQSGHTKSLRKYLITSLHGGIRQQLIDLAINSYQHNISLLLDIIQLLVDSTIRRINPRPGKQYFQVAESNALLNRLEESSATGLHELIIKVEVNQGKLVCCDNLSSGMSSLHSLLSDGLARNLRVLVLAAACDNHVLTLLGRFAVNLTSLDVSSNWLIDDLGIRHLILKDPGCLSFPPDLDSCENSVLCELAMLQDSALTAACFSLQEIRIQDTNTSGLSVLMLLLFIKNLRSLGGFIYYRNIGDAILTVEPYRPVLELTDLWDIHLPPCKVLRLSSVLPKLETLYTRPSELPQGVMPFEKLANMTVDFDFAHFSPQFVNFLSFNGYKLKKLKLIDQVFSLDLTTIAYCCPVITDLEANVTIRDHYPNASLQYLKFAKLRTSTAETLKWLMLHANGLQHLELLMEEDIEAHNDFLIMDDKLITDLVNCHPPSFDTIEYLSILLTHKFVGLSDADSLKSLISSCKRLRYLEDLQTWYRAMQAPEKMWRIIEETVENNYDIDVRFSGISLTDFHKKKEK